jgi:hypothetical protein
LLVIFVLPGASLTFLSSWKDKNNQQLPFYPSVIIVPIYNKIRVTFLDVHVLLTRFHLVLRHLLSPAASIEWDVHLTTTNLYKETIRTEQLISKEKFMSLVLRNHPKYVWRAVLMFKDRPLIEFLFDATDMARSLSVYYVHWYDDRLKTLLHGLLSKKDPKIQELLNKTLGPEFWQYLLTESQ